MNGTEVPGMEEYITRLFACFGKLKYLISVISQKLEKNTAALMLQERELYIFDRDNMRTNLDIVGDYIDEASDIIKELQEGLQEG